MTDIWSKKIRAVTDPELRGKLIKEMEDRGPVIVEHRFYRGASGPMWTVISDIEELDLMIEKHSRLGDDFWFWSFLDVCKDDNALGRGKVPDSEGRTPERGPY